MVGNLLSKYRKFHSSSEDKLFIPFDTLRDIAKVGSEDRKERLDKYYSSRVNKSLNTKKIVKNYILVPHSPIFYTQRKRSKQKHVNINNFYSYETVKEAMTILLNANLIQKEVPLPEFGESGDIVKRYMTRVTITPLDIWVDVFPDKDISIEDLLCLVGEVFSFSTSKHRQKKSYLDHVDQKKDLGIYLKDKSKDHLGDTLNLNKKGKTINSKGTNMISPTYSPKLKRSFKKINKGLGKLEYLYSYQRVFGKDENELGRLYNLFQRFPKKLRNEILNKYDLTELDFDGFNTNLLFLLKTGKKFISKRVENKYGRLPYSIRKDIYNSVLTSQPKIADLVYSNSKYLKPYRNIMKKCISSAFGTDSKSKTIGAIDGLLNEAGLNYYLVENYPNLSKSLWTKYLIKNKLDRAFVFRNILNRLEEECVDINEYLYTPTHFFSQNIESRIMEKLLLASISKKEIPLGIHDCIIVSQNNKPYFDELKESLLLEMVAKVNSNSISSKKKSFTKSLVSPIINSIQHNLNQFNTLIQNIKTTIKYKNNRRIKTTSNVLFFFPVIHRVGGKGG